jgi:acetoin utilization deacetylase AcuC-like enzyme
MSLQVPVVWSEDCLRHEPDGEVWLGVREPGTEIPARAVVLRDALAAAGAPVVPANRHSDEILRAVHDPLLLEHLAGLWREWEAGGYGRDRVVPYVFPTPGMLAGLPMRSPPAVHGRAGRFCYDTMTLVGPGSWEAIRGAADAALTAADLIREGHRLAYALCRPPGHHATRDAYGGSCYLNNAAIAAQAGAGAGFNRNLPLAPGAGDEEWLAALDQLCGEVTALAVDAVVVSLGLDAAAADPESPLQVTEAGYFAAGRRIAALGPAVLVQEGGYDLPSLGRLAVAAIKGATVIDQ